MEIGATAGCCVIPEGWATGADSSALPFSCREMEAVSISAHPPHTGSVVLRL